MKTPQLDIISDFLLAFEAFQLPSLSLSSSSPLSLSLNVSALSNSLACLSSWFNCLSSSSPSALSPSLLPPALYTLIPHSSSAALSALSLHSLCPMPHSCQTIFLPSSFSLSAKWQACPAFASLVIFFFHYVNDL